MHPILADRRQLGLYLIGYLPIGLVLASQQAGSPFVVAAALLAGVTVFVTWAVLRRSRLAPGGQTPEGQTPEG